MLSLRPRKDADLPALVRLLRQVHDHDGYPSAWPDSPAGFVAPPDELGAWVALGGGEVLGQVVLRHFGAELSEAGALPAWAALAGLPPERLGLVSRLFVAPAARRQGVAVALLRRAAAEAELLGRRGLLDVVSTSHAAAALYEREGWQRLGTVPAPWNPQLSVHVYLAPEETTEETARQRS